MKKPWADDRGTSQRGTTLVEVILVVLLVGIIGSAAAETVFQIFDANTRNNQHLTAIKQVENAVHWIGLDSKQAQSITTSGNSGFPLTLNWTDWITNDIYQVVYSLPSDNTLQRSFSSNGSTTNMTMARYISLSSTNIQVNGSGTYPIFFALPDSAGTADRFTITDSVGGDSGTIIVTGSGTVLITPLNGATISGGTTPVTIGSASGSKLWTTPTANSSITVSAASASSGYVGQLTSNLGTAALAMSADTDGDAGFKGARSFILSIVSVIGTGPKAANESRTVTMQPRPLQ